MVIVGNELCKSVIDGGGVSVDDGVDGYDDD